MTENEGKKTLQAGQVCQVEKNIEKGYLGMDHKTAIKKPKLLLHSCCGPCSTVCVERLVPYYDVTIFFYNPNITDEEEYLKRKKTQLKFIKGFNENPKYDAHVSFLEGPQDTREFFSRVSGMETIPEGGKRCGVCFYMRLAKTAEVAKMRNFDGFTTTLTVSPHKDYDTISAIGKKLGIQYKVSYVDENFKKQDGFKRSIEMSKKYDLYRQNYCGCRFSKWDEE